MYLDFKVLKKEVSIQKCIEMVKLKGKQKGPQFNAEPCPGCKRGKITVKTADNIYYCFVEEKGGDQIKFVAHVLGISNEAAAEQIATHFNVFDNSDNSPAPDTPDEPEECPELDYLDPLDDTVQALGMTPKTADLIGAGYSGNRGTMKGRVLIPLRTPKGRLLGYMGIATSSDQKPEYLFPKNLQDKSEDKIVRFQKKGA